MPEFEASQSQDAKILRLTHTHAYARSTRSMLKFPDFHIPKSNLSRLIAIYSEKGKHIFAHCRSSNTADLLPVDIQPDYDLMTSLANSLPSHVPWLVVKKGTQELVAALELRSYMFAEGYKNFHW